MLGSVRRRRRRPSHTPQTCGTKFVVLVRCRRLRIKNLSSVVSNESENTRKLFTSAMLFAIITVRRHRRQFSIRYEQLECTRNPNLCTLYARPTYYID